MTILVVWEPILPTDWGAPTSPVLARISDARAVQFWDKDHLVAKALRQQLSPSQICCQRNGIIWDVAALYPKGTQWEVKDHQFGISATDRKEPFLLGINRGSPRPETRAFQRAGWFRPWRASRDRLGSPCLHVHGVHKRAWLTGGRGWHLRRLRLGCSQADEETSDRRHPPYSLRVMKATFTVGT